MIDPTTAARWVERWDEQQEHYAEHREARFAAMTRLVGQATAAQVSPVVVDIGAGPGSLAARVAAAMPHARVVAIESDPFLVALGRAWCGDAVEFATETAGSPGWRTRLGLAQVQAVIASSALHYPPVARLRALYGEFFDWLSVDGILVNGDHFSDVGSNAQLPETGSDLGPWTTWWRDAAAADELRPLLALRSEIPAAEEDGNGDNGLAASDHLALLRDAGFGRADLPWQRGRSAIIVAGR